MEDDTFENPTIHIANNIDLMSLATKFDDEKEDETVNVVVYDDRLEVEAVEVEFDNEHLSHEERLQMFQQKQHITKYLFGKGNFLGTTN